MKNIETNVIYIRGTTQFAVKLPLRVYQPLCLYAAITGSAYWVMSLWDFQLGRDKICGRCLPGFHRPQLSVKRICRIRLRHCLLGSLFNLGV